MSTPRRRIITTHDVESAAYAGATELAYDQQTSIVTPLARERANDLNLALRPSGAPRHRHDATRSKPGASAAPKSDVVGELRPELAAEVLRRVQRRLEQK